MVTLFELAERARWNEGEVWMGGGRRAGGERRVAGIAAEGWDVKKRRAEGRVEAATGPRNNSARSLSNLSASSSESAHVAFSLAKILTFHSFSLGYTVPGNKELSASTATKDLAPESSEPDPLDVRDTHLGSDRLDELPRLIENPDDFLRQRSLLEVDEILLEMRFRGSADQDVVPVGPLHERVVRNPAESDLRMRQREGRGVRRKSSPRRG